MIFNVFYRRNTFLNQNMRWQEVCRCCQAGRFSIGKIGPQNSFSVSLRQHECFLQSFGRHFCVRNCPYSYHLLSNDNREFTQCMLGHRRCFQIWILTDYFSVDSGRTTTSRAPLGLPSKVTALWDTLMKIVLPKRHWNFVFLGLFFAPRNPSLWQHK